MLFIMKIPPQRERLHSVTTVLLIFLFVSAAALSVKCSADLIRYSHRFPVWFVPSFVVGIAALLSAAAAMVRRAFKARDKIHWARGSEARDIWILVALSFVYTSAVHGFYPFRPAPLALLLAQDAVFKLYMVLALLGFIVSAACGVLYSRGKRQAAVLTLLSSAVFLLAPSDNCINPFNYWWLENVGASPLVFVPNLFAIIFGTVGLVGVHTRLNTWILAGTGMSVGLLGLGHLLRVIW